MTIEAVVGDVELAADEPFGVGRLPFESFLGGFEPVEQLGLFAPELFGIGCCSGVQFAVFLERADARVLAEFFWRRDRLLFQNVRIEFLHDGDSSVVRARGAMGRYFPFARPYVIEPEGFGQGGDSGVWRRRSRRFWAATGYWRNTDGALKCAATRASSSATSKPTHGLPGPISRDRPPQSTKSGTWRIFLELLQGWAEYVTRVAPGRPIV